MFAHIDPHGPNADHLAAGALTDLLNASGRPPHSLCEARLSDNDYRWLLGWAREAPPNAFRSESDSQRAAAGLTLLALLAEWNRRESDGDSAFLGAVALFGDGETRRALFLANGQPHPRLRECLREGAVRHHLRHAFGEATASAPWYLTVQLQYGFCRRQLPRVGEWLRGLPVTEAMHRLLSPTGPARSRSFAQLMSDLRQFRRGYTPQVTAYRQLESCPWVLGEWVGELLELTRRRPGEGDADGYDEATHEPPLVERAALEWSSTGPVVRVRTAPPRGDGIAPRYSLTAGGKSLATWFLQPPSADGSPEYRTAGKFAADVELPTDEPAVVFRLTDDAGELAGLEEVVVWDVTAEVQVLGGSATPTVESVQWEAGRDVVLVVRPQLTPSVPPDAWCLTGYGRPTARRWLRYASSPLALRVSDADGRTVWEASAASPPKWANGAVVEAARPTLPAALGEDVAFRVRAAGGARVEWIVADGRPLTHDPASGCTGRLPLSPTAAGSGHRLRVGLERNGVRAVRHEVVRTPCRGLARRADDGWHAHRADWFLFAGQIRRDLFRVFTEADGPAVLLEGYEVVGRATDRPHRLVGLLGTGAPLDLATSPYNVTHDGRHRLAAGVQDNGVVSGGRWPKKWPGPIRLRLDRPLAPAEGHFVLLWSNRHGLHRVRHDGITPDPSSAEWSVDLPWSDEPDAVVAAVGFDTHRLGFCWFRQWHRFFSTGPHDHPSLTPCQRFALARWLRLPVLALNQRTRPQLEALAHAHPADLLAVNQSADLGGLPGGIDLTFDTDADRLAADAIARQLLLDPPLPATAAEAVGAVFGVGPAGGTFDALLVAAHPILAVRTALALWPSERAVNRGRLCQNLREVQSRLAGLPTKTTNAAWNGRLNDLLASACRTFGENNRTLADDVFVRQAIVQPARRFAFNGHPLDPTDRHNLLVALGAGDFRLHLALTLLRELEDRL